MVSAASVQDHRHTHLALLSLSDLNKTENAHDTLPLRYAPFLSDDFIARVFRRDESIGLRKEAVVVELGVCTMGFHAGVAYIPYWHFSMV